MKASVVSILCVACSSSVPPAEEPVIAESQVVEQAPPPATAAPDAPAPIVVDKAPKPPEESRPPPETAAPAPPRLAGPFGDLLDAHNRHRARHCAPPLEWSAEVARGAQAWADELVRRGCAFAHSGTRLGENLAGATAGTLGGEGVADLWYSEGARYDFRRPGFSIESGHFTQVVWVSSRRIGCGTAACRGNDVWVCRYDPAGNMEGEYRENVLPTSCR